MGRQYLKLRNNQHRKSQQGFTLLESLIALLLLSTICFLFSSVLRNSKGVIEQLKTTEEKAWHIFLIQLENELESCQFEEVLPNKIVLKSREKKKNVWIENKLGKIVKVENGGYQPMLTNVGTANFDRKENCIEITVLFENNQKFVARWVIDKENVNEK